MTMTDTRVRSRGARPQGQRRTPPPRTRQPQPGRAGRGPSGPPPRPPALKVGEPARRQSVLMVLSLIVLALFVARLIEVQVVHADELSAAALEQRLVTASVTEPRADIVDRNGEVLATSVDRYHIWVNQVELGQWGLSDQGVEDGRSPLDAAVILAPLLGMSEAELAADLVGDDTFRYIARNVTPETQELIAVERIAGIHWEATSQRLYPNGAIAGNVVGFMGGDSERPGVWGIAGVEYAYEDLLLGEDGFRTYEKSRYGTIIPTGIHEEQASVPGSTVRLTIDRDIQWRAQQILDQAVRDTGGDYGTAVVADAVTGEIYALIDTRSVDPNDPGASTTEDRGSRAVSTVFEPGSTAKVITMAAALEEGIATPTSRYVAPYKYTTANGEEFRDSHPHPDQQLTLAGVLVSSSNTGTIKIGEQLDEETRHRYLSAFGFGERTGIGLPGESPGILHPWQEWDGRTEYGVLFGQGVSVTALQATQVYATIANGGVRVAPSIVAGFEGPDGTFTPRETAPPERVISEETADQLMLMLESVTANGTGSLARIDGYRVAGKTGTSQASDETGALNSVVASFVGIAPADEPRIVVSVMIDDPQTSIWGGEVAAPVFSDIAAFALQSLGVEPSGPAEELYPTTWE